MNEEEDFTINDAQKIVDEMMEPKVTKRHIEAKISEIDYLTHGTLTVCIITMENGYKQVGTAAPAAPENYRAEVGRRFAYEDAFRGLWALEGYLMREKLAEEEDIREIEETLAKR